MRLKLRSFTQESQKTRKKKSEKRKKKKRKKKKRKKKRKKRTTQTRLRKKVPLFQESEVELVSFRSLTIQERIDSWRQA